MFVLGLVLRDAAAARHAESGKEHDGAHRTVIRVCDLHDGDADGSRALFVIDSRIYQVDTCPAHAAELRAAVALVERARAAALSMAAQRAHTEPARWRPRTGPVIRQER